jgi:hypothetical protein
VARRGWSARFGVVGNAVNAPAANAHSAGAATAKAARHQTGAATEAGRG